MANVKTSDSGRRYVDADEVVETRMAKLRADSREASATEGLVDASWISDPPHVAGIYWMRNWLEDDAKYVYRIVEITWIEDYWGGRWMRKGWYLLTIYDRNNYPETVKEFVGGMEKVAFQGPIHPQE